MRIIVVTSLLLLFLSTCSGDKQNFTVNVTVKNTDGSTLYLARRTLSGTIAVDSVSPDKEGNYVLEGYTAEPDFYIVYRVPRHYINLIINPGDDFRVITDATSFEYNYIIEGSKDSRLIQKMVSMQAKTLARITALTTEFENSTGSPGFEKTKARIDSTYEQVVKAHQEFSKQLIHENMQTLASLMALYQQLGRNIPVFDYKSDFGYYEMVDSSLSTLYPNSNAVRDLNRKVNELRDLLRLETGAMAPEIQLPDTDGTIQSLSSLRGNYVLILFWASWSSQSLEAVRELSGWNKKFGDKALECYQVSLDRTKESWIQSIESEKATGINVSDLKYWDSPVVDQYQITKLPVMYLLDKEGKIIDKNFSINDLPELLSGFTDNKEYRIPNPNR